MNQRHLLTALLLPACIQAAAQQVRISDFRQVSAADSERSADLASPVRDADGKACAVLVLETGESGWTFEAGLAGIVDVQSREGQVRVWLPSGAKELSVSHPRLGTLRGWPIPVSMAPGGIYAMKLGAIRPTPVRTFTGAGPRRTAPQRRIAVAPDVPRVSPKGPCSHFIDAYVGFVQDELESEDLFFGMRYTYLGGRIGPYVSAALSRDESWSVSGGLALRLSSGKGNPDWQLYGGAGLVDVCTPSGEAGVRVGWLSDGAVSRWDFGAGCQVWEGVVMPTVEVGLCIWGIPVVIGLGLCLGAL